MLKILALIMLATVLIDVTIGFIWVGIIGYSWLRESYRDTFPNGTIIDKAIAKIGEKKDDTTPD